MGRGGRQVASSWRALPRLKDWLPTPRGNRNAAHPSGGEPGAFQKLEKKKEKERNPSGGMWNVNQRAWERAETVLGPKCAPAVGQTAHPLCSAGGGSVYKAQPRSNMTQFHL